MKLFLKILKIGAIAFFSLIFLLVAIGWLMQDKITKMAIEEVSEVLGAPLGMGNVSFSLVSDFPLATVQFDNLWLGSRPYGDSTSNAPFDTLAKFERIYVSVESKPLLDNIFKIRKIEVEEGYVKYLVDETGATCYDFLMATDSTAVPAEDTTAVSAPLDLTLEKLTLKNISCLYKDEQMKAGMKVFIPELVTSAKMDALTTQAVVQGALQLSNGRFENTNLYRMQQADVQFDLIYAADTLKVNELNIETEGLSTKATGQVAFTEKMFVDLSLSTSIPELAALLKYAPDGLLDEFEVSQVSGAIGLQAQVRGVYSDTEMPHYSAKVDLSKATLKYQNYPLVYNLGMSASANNGSANHNQTTAVTLRNVRLDCSGNSLAMKADFYNLDQLKFDISSELNLDLEASRAFIPDSLIQKPSGKITAKLKTKGVLPDSIDDQFIKDMIGKTSLDLNWNGVNMDMDTISVRQLSGNLAYKNYSLDLRNLHVSIPKYDLRLINNSVKVQFNGDVFKPESLKINLPAFHFATPESSITGSARLNRMKHLTFDVQSHLDLDLAYLKQFVDDSLVTNMSGQVIAHIKSFGKLNLDSVATQAENIVYDNSAYDVTFKNINVNMPDTLMNVSQLNGKVSVDKDLIQVTGLAGTVAGIDFNIKQTEVRNLYNTVMRNQAGMLQVVGDYELGDLDYAMLGALIPTEDTTAITEPSAPEITEPKRWNMDVRGNISVKSFKYDEETSVYGLTVSYQMTDTAFETKGKLAIDRVEYGNATITDIAGLYNVNDSVYIVDQLEYQAFEGSGNAAIKVMMKPDDEMLIQMKAQVARMNVRTVLKDMDNLYQDALTYEQMSGIATTDNFYLQLTMIGDSLVYPEMRMSMDLKFENGGIYNYPVVQDMAQYLPSVNNLDSLVFKTISSNIFIFQDAIYIPETLVVTDAFDVYALGKQTFGENYQYHIGVNFAEILRGKSKKKKKKQAAMGDEVTDSDRKFTWLQSTGRDGKYTNGFDKEDVRKEMIKNIKGARALLKFRFLPQRFEFETNVEQ